MGQIVFVPREIDAGEPRVGASPETVKRLVGLGFDVIVEAGAGLGSRVVDADFIAAGASIGKASDAGKADVVLKVRRPTEAELKGYKKGAAVIATMDPYGNDAAVVALAKAGVTAFAMEFMPRITRAQVMDVLSSQANLAGYQAVIDAAGEYDRALPMMMTAAGTVPAAKVFVMGAGVAGLQAIATARRLGAVVTATDVRPAAKEQVASLGAKFVAVEDEEFKAAETAGGYAKEMSKEYQAKQAALVADHIAKQDIVITTALIPGRPAPKLVSAAMVKSMKPGSVLVDLAVERGGNVEGAVAGKVVTSENGVKIVGHLNVPGRVAASASLLYAKNLFAFLETMVDKESKQFAINREDELVKATMLTDGGKVVHPNFAALADTVATEPAAPDAAEQPPKKPAVRKTTAAKKSSKPSAGGDA
ncbi:MAG TPA: Re/Si-specific NAD(P)(+) transhydrogenase subunit alpha [Rhizobiaceae bacterium]|nr:Re/Si-specific NAD(P)(+) transhydrogenase subunit alpha [Rhizobiaceae bacterium]